MSTTAVSGFVLFATSCTIVIFSTIRRSISINYKSKAKKENSSCVYLDYNATTPIYKEVAENIKDHLTCYGNPSSIHTVGQIAKNAILTARTQIGELVNAPQPLESIIFTSCGTESDNRAVDFAIYNFSSTGQNRSVKPQVITCVTEHPAVVCYLRQLQIRSQINLIELPVDSQGFINAALVEKYLTPQTALVTIMHSNNEVGTIQPIRDISHRIRQYNSSCGANIILHTDGAQSVGKVPVDVQALGVDMMTIVGHKMGAPKGIAALYVAPKFMPKCIERPMLIGGGQERGIRSGTESTLLISALGEAARIAHEEKKTLPLRLLSLKLYLVSKLKQVFGSLKNEFQAPVMIFNGPNRGCNVKEIESDLTELTKMFSTSDALPSRRLFEQLPNTVSVSFWKIDAQQLLLLLTTQVACSAGSACHSTTVHISPVLAAMKVPPEYALGTLRLSVGRDTLESEIDMAVESINQAITSLRK